LLVNVEAWSGLAHEHADGLKLEKILPRLRVDGIAVRIRARRQVNFGPVDMQEAARPASGECGGFGGVDDIIRHAGHLGDVRWNRDQTLKGADTHGGVTQNGLRIHVKPTIKLPPAVARETNAP
jgi:hypothetical protein